MLPLGTFYFKNVTFRANILSFGHNWRGDQMSDFTARICETVSRALHCAPESLGLGTHFTFDLGIDSLDAIEVMLDVEDSFGIEFPDDALEHIFTIGDLANFVKGATASQTASVAA